MKTRLVVALNQYIIEKENKVNPTFWGSLFSKISNTELTNELVNIARNTVRQLNEVEEKEAKGGKIIRCIMMGALARAQLARAKALQYDESHLSPLYDCPCRVVMSTGRFEKLINEVSHFETCAKYYMDGISDLNPLIRQRIDEIEYNLNELMRDLAPSPSPSPAPGGPQ